MKLGKFASNSGWDIAQSLYMSGISFIIGLFSARYLGTENYGLISIVNSMLTMVTSIAWLGIDSIVINEFVTDRENEERIIGSSIAIRLVMSAAALPVCAVIIKYVYNDPAMQTVFIILGAAMMFQIYEIFHWWLQSCMRIKLYSLVMMAVSTVLALYQVFLIVTRKNVYWFASVHLFNSLFVFIGMIGIYFFKFKKRIGFSSDVLGGMLKKSSHFVVSAVAITLYMQIDKLMIGKMLSNSEAGCYTAAVTVGELWRFVPLAVINAARPLLFEYKKNNEEKFEYFFKRLIFLLAFFMFFICIFITVFAGLIIKILYGGDYADAAAPLQITTWATFFSMLGVMRSIWIVSNNFNRYDKYFTVSAAVLNIVLNYFFIKSMGITGAALSTLISYIFETTFVNHAFRDTRAFNSLIFRAFAEYRESFGFLGEKLKGFGK